MFKRFIKPVYAHCDVPCGIYETDSMAYAAATCKKMVERFQALGDPTDPEQMNEFVRLITTKEEHAQKCKDQLYLLWSDFFKPEHLQRTPDLHDRFWQATKQCGKVRQTLNIAECDKLIDMVQGIAQIFAESKK